MVPAMLAEVSLLPFWGGRTGGQGEGQGQGQQQLKLHFSIIYLLARTLSYSRRVFAGRGWGAASLPPGGWVLDGVLEYEGVRSL